MKNKLLRLIEICEEMAGIEPSDSQIEDIFDMIEECTHEDCRHCDFEIDNLNSIKFKDKEEFLELVQETGVGVEFYEHHRYKVWGHDGKSIIGRFKFTYEREGENVKFSDVANLAKVAINNDGLLPIRCSNTPDFF